MDRATRAGFVEPFGLLLFGSAGFAALWSFLLRHGPSDGLWTGGVAWWTVLWAVSVVNLCAWYLSAAALTRRKTTEPARHLFRRRQLLLSAVYVIGCGFRSVLPRADVQRIGLYDSWASSV